MLLEAIQVTKVNADFVVVVDTQTRIEMEGPDLGVREVHGVCEGVDYGCTTYPTHDSMLLLGEQDVEVEKLVSALNLG